MKSYFEILNEEVNNGLEGKNEGISFGFPRLDMYTSLRKSTLYLFGGFTGSGKTTCADEIFVLNPWEQLRAEGKGGKLKIVYWSMERKMSFKFAKWFGRKCFLDHGIRIPMERLIGWVKKTHRLTQDEHDLFKTYSDYFGALQEDITIFDGRQKPTAIRSYIKDLMEGEEIGGKRVGGLGRVHKISKYREVFEADDPSLIVLNVFDHVGKLKMESRMASDKEVIDKFSDDVSNTFRDFYGVSSVIVSQFNRSIANPMRLKNDDVTPMLEDFKSTSDLAEDSDVVMSIFDPWRYKVSDPSGYDLDKLRDQTGAKFYRNFQILKNSYGREDVRIGFAFEPEMGIFREMPKQVLTTEEHYDKILTGEYFLPER